jgi:hypothetical protein
VANFGVKREIIMKIMGRDFKFAVELNTLRLFGVIFNDASKK